MLSAGSNPDGGSNHLDIAPPGGAHRATDAPVNATKDPLSISGHGVYSAYFEGGMGYRRDATTGIATGDEAQTVYMVTSGTHFNNRCCFDYGARHSPSCHSPSCHSPSCHSPSPMRSFRRTPVWCQSCYLVSLVVPGVTRCHTVRGGWTHGEWRPSQPNPSRIRQRGDGQP